MSKIHYQVHSTDNSKPWVVLIHGLFGSLDNLSGLRRHFCKDFQVLSVDLPDHGKSEHTQTFSFENYATLIMQLLDELGIQATALIGHSLGGKVAMTMALKQPNIISHLVVIDIAPVDYAPRHTQVIEGLKSVDLQRLANRGEADKILQEFIPEASTRMFLLKSLYAEDNQWHWRFNLDLLQRDYDKLSKGIESDDYFNHPVLFIKGELSDYLQLSHRDHILKLFPNAQSKIVGKTGHWLHAEKPELCFKIACEHIQADSMVKKHS